MNTIQPSFTERGFKFTQVAREGMCAVFHRGKPGGTGHYEIVRIRVAPATVIMGREYPEREVYPCAESWGIDGFTVMDEKTALERLSQMANAA